MINDQWNASVYATHASYVSKLAQEVLNDLAAQPGEKILDLGCGNGELALNLQQSKCHVIGIDSSSSLIKVAKDAGIDARLQRAEQIEFESCFDAVFSNAAMHWMKQQDEVIRRVYRALRPSGRFIVEMGGDGNIETIRQALSNRLAEQGIDFRSHNPWIFPSANEQRARLEAAGFTVQKCVLRTRPTLLPTDVEGWFKAFGNAILPDFHPKRLTQLINQLVEDCRPNMCDHSGCWTVDYVRLNWIALKTGRGRNAKNSSDIDYNSTSYR